MISKMFPIDKFKIMRKYFIAILGTVIIGLFSCQSSTPAERSKYLSSLDLNAQELDTATLAGGCFWCVEAALEQLQGVAEVVSGYSGGKASTANYSAVSRGSTRHAEAVQVYFNASVIDYETLLKVFLTAHDPTQLNRQGPDVGPQYRSAIFYHNQKQKTIAEEVMKKEQERFSDPIVTELSPLQGFYVAESYHQDYQKKNPFQPYIVRISKPKVEKVKKKFPDLIKPDAK
jgi:peptide-methionine (S)-S-oxide reductase